MADPYGARFYNYQYSFAFLCSFGLAALRRADPAGFGDPVRPAMLRAGGSLPPAGLLAICGLDPGRPRACGSWDWTRSTASAESAWCRSAVRCRDRPAGPVWGGSYLFNEIALREVGPGVIVWGASRSAR